MHGKKGQNKICENDLPQIKFRFFHGEVNFAPAKKAEFGKSKVLHSCIIGITLMHKQVINFLRKLVTNYNRNYANQEYRKEESIYFHRQVLKKESLYE